MSVLHIPTSFRAADMVTSLPARVRAFLKEGLRAFDLAYASNPDLILQVAATTVSLPVDRDDQRLHQLNVSSPEQSNILGGVLNVLALLAAQSSDTPEEIADALIKPGIAQQQYKEKLVQFFARLRESNPGIRDVVKRNSLAHSVFPTLISVEMSVDLRLRADEGGILAVLVLLAHIDTDVAHHEFWFQMTRTQAEKLIEELKASLSLMDSCGETCLANGCLMFEMPHFTFAKVLYTCIGASVFWGVWGRNKLKPFIFFDLIKHLPVSKEAQEVIEFLLFLALGCVVGIGFTDPSNPRQALTAGFGWTGVFARMKKNN